jgi:hypothetical protein
MVRRLENAALQVPNAAAVAELRRVFRVWAEIEPRIAMAELKPLAHRLAQAALIGLRALKYLESGETPPESWTGEQTQSLAAMEQPSAEVVLAAARPVRLLVTAASRPTTPPRH